jgi:hypothetical protein
MKNTVAGAPPSAGKHSPQFLDERLPSRFWDKVQPCPMSGCWLFISSHCKAGYGSVGDGRGRVTKAHQMAYETLVGPVPAGLELDHLCRVRCCCNPAHLEPVTHAENMRRGERANRPACPSGHRYDEQNTIWYDGRRYCRECSRRRNRDRQRVVRALAKGAR